MSLLRTQQLARLASKNAAAFSTKPLAAALSDSAAAAITSEPTLMSNSEALVESLVAQGVTNTFGIVGSAFMDPLDLMDAAGIRFVPVQHEQNAAHMADGYARVSGKHGVCIAQNGPGITNFVTGVAAAYWAHSPVVTITPEAASLTKGHGGFQEIEQLPIFESITKYQAHVNNPKRMAELTSRAFDIAMNERGPVQLNIPRDYMYGENEFNISGPNNIERSAGGPASLAAAAELLAGAKNPVILAGGGVVMSGATEVTKKLAELMGCPVAVTYLHNDAFPSDHQLMTGPLGYCGSQAAMKCMAEADVILALGTRLGPFGTLPQYGIDYWPKTAKIVQVELDARRIGLVRPADVAICGDARLAAEDLLSRLQQSTISSAADKAERVNRVQQYKAEWESQLDSMATANEARCPPGKLLQRQALRELEKAMPDNAIVSTDIGNTCSVSNSYLRFKQPNSFLAAMAFGNCGYAFPVAMGAKIAAPERTCIAYAGDGAWGMSMNEVLTCVREDIPTTAVVFNNGQWGAEKKNQVLWFGDRYVGSQLKNPSFAEVSRAMGAEGIQVDSLDAVGDALRQAAANQADGKTTVVELMMSKELGEPFRRDAMKLPQRVLKKYQHTSETSESSTGQPTDL